MKSNRQNLNPSYVGLRKDIINVVPFDGEKLKILDVGCSTGINGRYLLEKGIAYKVLGFEYDKKMASDAEKIYDKVFQGDIENLNINECLAGQQFDGLIFGDVLEHLRNPEAVLRDLVQVLKPGGFCIISVPNMQHIEALWRLGVNGYWPENDRGIFDKTHLQIFTKRNLEMLTSSVGLKREKIFRNFRFRDRLGATFPFYAYPLRILLPNLYTFQYISLSFKD